MKPPPFEYLAPESLGEALAAKAEHGADAKILAGGQSLVPVLNFRLAAPAVLIDLNRVAELDYLDFDADGTLRVGAMTRQRRVEREPRVAEVCPLLAEALPWIAHPQIRNRGTMGGTLAHADPAAELPVVALALGAELVLCGPRGERRVPAADFYRGLFDTALADDEILVEAVFPPLAAPVAVAFVEIARRHGDYAQAGVAAVVRGERGGGVAEARLVYLSAGETPVAAPAAAAILVEGGLEPEAIDAAARRAAADEIAPSSDIHAPASFKRHLAAVLTRRALELARLRLAVVAA